MFHQFHTNCWMTVLVHKAKWFYRSGSSAMVPKKTAQEAEAVGNSRGGLSTKIHAAVDVLGNPVRLLLTAGQASEYGQSNALIGGLAADYVLTDKGYDSDLFIVAIKVTGGDSGDTGASSPSSTACI